MQGRAWPAPGSSAGLGIISLAGQQSWTQSSPAWSQISIHGASLGKAVQFRSVQSLSRVQLFATLWTVARQASLSITNSRSLLKLMSMMSQRCRPSISFSVVPFSSCLQSFPASGSSPMSQFFSSGGQSIGVSASASVLPINI